MRDKKESRPVGEMEEDEVNKIFFHDWDWTEEIRTEQMLLVG